MTQRPSTFSSQDYIEPDEKEDGCLLFSSEEDEWEKNNPRHSGRYPTSKSLNNDPRMPKPCYKTRTGIVSIIVFFFILCGVAVLASKDRIRIARLRRMGVPPGLYSRNGVLYVGEHTPFMIKGFSWYGMEEDGLVPGGLEILTVDDVFEFTKENGFNAIRLPLSVENIIQGKIAPMKSFKNPDLSGLIYIDLVKKLVQKAAHHNILILLDMHRLENHEIKSRGLWYSATVKEERLSLVWRILCDHVGDEWNVVGADIYNEPWDALWNSPNKSADWKHGSEKLGNTIHGKCPSWTIFIQGVGDRANSTKTLPFWAENLRAMYNAPPELTLKEKVVLSPHVYGPGVFMQDYFEGDDFVSKMPAIWDAHFGGASNVTGIATVVGEWGGFYQGKDREWLVAFSKYIKERKMSSFFWCLNPESIDTGGLLEEDWTTPSRERLSVLQDLPSTSVEKHAVHFKHWRNWRS